MRPIIYPYKMGSKSAKALKDELVVRGHRALRVRPDGNYKSFASHLVINWGNSLAPTTWSTVGRFMLNKPLDVAQASNKLSAFKLMKEAGNVSIPEFTADREEAIQWDGNIVVRWKLSGHSGEGIDIWDAEEIDDVPHHAPLYVKYMKKKEEYRVHVFKDRVIDVQQKRKRSEVPNEEVDYKVRNHANGWVFCRDNVSPNQLILDNAIAAVRALGLDFGAADVIWNEYHNKAYVLEVNTAPGLEGTTVKSYSNAIEELL